VRVGREDGEGEEGEGRDKAKEAVTARTRRQSRQSRQRKNTTPIQRCGRMRREGRVRREREGVGSGRRLGQLTGNMEWWRLRLLRGYAFPSRI
jgi:hypothetical protein